MLSLYHFFAAWPLRGLHALGIALGWLTWLASPTWRRRMRENATLAGYSAREVRAAVGHAGCMVTETPRLWFGRAVPVQWDGIELADAAAAAGRGVVYLTPHLGCFEITAMAVGKRHLTKHGPITVLYRRPRQAVLVPVMEQARQSEGMQTAPDTLSGVRQLIRALRQGRAVGLLPDQVPPDGMGLWSPFFGQPAYTMTLAARLVQQTGAELLLAWGERLPRGRGFCVHLEPFPEVLSDDIETAVTQINRAMERLIRRCPQQYLWGYGRYKTPRKVSA